MRNNRCKPQVIQFTPPQSFFEKVKLKNGASLETTISLWWKGVGTTDANRHNVTNQGISVEQINQVNLLSLSSRKA